MKRWFLVVFCCCIFVSNSWTETQQKGRSGHGAGPAEWTVMVYMNGRNNNLETEALCDFYEMLSASFSRPISLVVELSLDGKRPSHNGMTSVRCPDQVDMVDVPYWSGTRQFAIANKITGRKYKPHTENLGDPKALKEFVEWARKHYPATRYMLDLWSHGEAIPRAPIEPLSAPGDKKGPTVAPLQPLTEDKIEKLHFQNDGGAISMYKSDGSHILLNSEIREALKKSLKSAKLDLIAFDACNKSMIETAFAMHDVAETMVASEERVPDEGWEYDDVLSTLNSDPRQARAKLGTLLVQSYREFYEHKTDATTMASMNLHKLMPVVDQLDRLAYLLLLRPQLWDAIMKARGNTPPYQFQAVDLNLFLASLRVELVKVSYSNKDISDTLNRIDQQLLRFIAQPPYASQNSSRDRGSKGVAIYFPSSQEEYRCDPDFRYYDPDDPQAIPFFKEHCWGRFLKTVLPYSGVMLCKLPPELPSTGETSCKLTQ
jgi:hypothetical protein